jgi:hypothetical protein
VCSTGATFTGNGEETVSLRTGMIGQKMETQTGPKKAHREKICVTILNKVG